MNKIRKDIKENLPHVDKALSEAGDNILKALDTFLTNVVEGTGRFFESPFKDKEKKPKS
ncbi:MAG TPA: hypothetical protein QGF08_06265 [Candidatus Marinimicrobia bacterium]|jgi:hypothetical protein|nr:hypothetical protein [Candidatus Neomarinimicrobiota bacterium]MDP7436828.1 hypothetical protein [Candidatus Neomarinimicrobiota bacterium]MDP7653514.1 hypothetical protein [Candidatus Neomarinimicrobiota bacterium]HJL74797.1 hypothetical protein [Candidatus Neomarinimicrobiota bacterium]HJM70467.1 hypothetical protein [Candidatus Neomarinimicrobiota bacterium]|tara:strand:+ start:1252 stop:1428 length:177 start_codon:yes stop_codon:yes gene_type:complete